MFNVHPDDVERLKSPGGDRFAGFVNDLLFAHALSCGISASAVHLNIQTNVGDGGVDAEVANSVSDPLGWLSYPSAWQFKGSGAENAGPAKLVADIQKAYAKERIIEGYSYTVCICDHLTQSQRSKREKALIRAAKEINPTAPAPRILDANDLAMFASRFPALVLQYFHADIQGWCLSIEAWKPNAESLTSHYVVSPTSGDASRRVELHLNFAEVPQDALLILRGESGVGKTRFAFETINLPPGMGKLAVFAIDEAAAIRLATHLANTSLSAVLIADEMTTSGIATLRAILNGHKSRIRTIAIESNEDDYHREDRDAIWIDAISDRTLDEILEKNFPTVDPERRRGYAYLAEGSIRYAVELCRQDEVIVLEPGIPRIPFVRNSISRILSSDEYDAVRAVSLVFGVGSRDDVAAELTSLCSLLGLNEDRVRQSASRVREAPGFIASAGRYWYVKPPIVAHVAFEEAWSRWAAHNEREFLERIAASGALKKFLRQVGRIASQEVRLRVSDFFQDWAAELKSENLEKNDDVMQLLDLIEINPGTFLGDFQRIIKSASDHTLTSSVTWDPSRREARYELVRAARRVSSLPEYFHEAEEILLRLALAESEPRTMPNGTSSYKQLFKVYLSGTALPFKTRLAALEQRVRHDDIGAVLAVEALSDILDSHNTRGVDEPVVAGRLVSSDWQPATNNERIDCYLETIKVLQWAITNASDSVRDEVWKCLLPKIRDLVSRGFVESLGSLFPVDLIPASVRERVVIELKSYIEWVNDAEDDTERRRMISISNEDALRTMFDALNPGNPRERLRILLATDYWRARVLDPASPWRREMREIAMRLIQDPSEFTACRELLFEPKLPTGFQCGFELGGQDTEGTLLRFMLDAMSNSPESVVPSGYISGLMERTSSFRDQITAFLNIAEISMPNRAFELAQSVETTSLALRRMIRIVDAGHVLAVNLPIFLDVPRMKQLSNAEFEQILQRLVVATRKDHDLNAAIWGLTIVKRRLHYPKKKTQFMDLDENVIEHLWVFVDSVAASSENESSSWSRIFDELALVDPNRATKIAAKALASDNNLILDSASNCLITMAGTAPDFVMAELSQVMLNPDLQFSFDVHSHSKVIAALPFKILDTWLSDHGRDGAVALAYHLPQPFVSDAQQPIVPVITGKVLTDFGDDPEVFSRFCQATIFSTRYVAEETTAGLSRQLAVLNRIDVFRTHANPMIRKWVLAIEDRVKAREKWITADRRDDLERRFR